MPVSDAQRAKIKRRILGIWRLPPEGRLEVAEEIKLQLKAAGLTDGEVVAFWAELSREFLEDLGLELPVENLPEAS